MRERHEMETGALLNALSDSQRIVKVLREENTELRERLADRDAERDELIAERRELEEQARERFDLAERVGELEEENAALRSFVDGLRREVAAWEMKAACSDITDGDISSISQAGIGRIDPDECVRFDPEVGAPDVGEEDEDLTARIRKRGQHRIESVPHFAVEHVDSDGRGRSRRCVVTLAEPQLLSALAESVAG